MKFQKNIEAERTSIQLAPMIDIVFLLLIFFIVLWKFARFETEIDISVPSASAGENPKRSIGEIIVNVHTDGRIVAEGSTRTAEQLLAIFTDIVEAHPDQAVILRGDKQAAFDHIMKVLNVCQQAGIWNVAFATAPLAAAPPSNP